MTISLDSMGIEFPRGIMVFDGRIDGRNPTQWACDATKIVSHVFDTFL